MNKKAFFLFTEISGYMLNCFEKSVDNGYDIHAVVYPINNDAPFKFENSNKINFYNRSEFSSNIKLIELISSVNPEIIVVSGWIDKEYLKVAKFFRKSTKTIIAFDTQWVASFKQIIFSIIGRYFLKKRFKYAWVPGDKQYKYAEKLGFNSSEIFKYLYTCNTDIFFKNNFDILKAKSKSFPKVFLFVGRYAPSKGLNQLCQSFLQLKKQEPNKWELWCVGTGPSWNNRILHSSIKHLGFKQPNEFESILCKTGVYVLPSNFEPWGVSLHEFTCAGYPIISSDISGASSELVINGSNGFIYSNNDNEELKQVMKKIISLTDLELLNMAKVSVDLSKKFSPDKWVNSLNLMCK